MSARSIPLGPALVAIGGLELSAPDRERLLHPLTGGVVLFAPNFSTREQLQQLCAEIHSLREPRLLICADQEGGRVQRFTEGFTRLPPMRRLGELWDRDTVGAQRLAHACGLTMAAELRACGVDLSLAPVLDVDHGASTIIGDRAFHSDPAAIAALAEPLIDGMQAAGMASVGKHFPGHGYIAADSHLELPVDGRGLEAIAACDLLPFARLATKLGGMMPAHVLYPQVDALPAGFSAFWIRDVLRTRLQFKGAVFSDDLGMAGASGAGDLDERARAAIEAGCDLVLACTPEGADSLLGSFRYTMPGDSARRLSALVGRQLPEPAVSIAATPEYEAARQSIWRALA